MYIEDYLSQFYFGKIRVGTYDSNLAQSLSSQVVFNQKAFTEKQAAVALKLLDKYKNQFISIGFTNIILDLSNPTFKYPFRSIENTKSVRIENGKIIIKFPFDQSLVNSLREISNSSFFCKATFDGDTKSWNMDLNEESLVFVETKLISKNFEISSDILDLIGQMENIRHNMENFVPMLVKNEKNYSLKNCLIEKNYDNLFSAVVDATKKGIYVHDDVVNQELLEETKINPIFKIFTVNSNKLLVNNEQYSKQELISLSKKFDTHVAIFFEDDATTNTLIQWYESLIDCGVKNEEIAVYYRKPSSNDKGFNQTIKDLRLNKEAEDKNVKWMFLSSKYPKSLFKNNKIADICIFVDRHVTTHYTTINVSNNCLLSIRYSDKKIAELENSYNVKRGEKLVIL